MNSLINSIQYKINDGEIEMSETLFFQHIIYTLYDLSKIFANQDSLSQFLR